ncbi:hypothetical protein EYZ11_005466 [Aspergillus tanneri]|uniref:Uncharacterized protein n=1 Tax=Aspergillus tanneri TaxID=1220188 RepID=A0A4S3JNW8_9EURO|nr:hypothetical protein EYZ11_005466 [Aspergillus tanneri]
MASGLPNETSDEDAAVLPVKFFGNRRRADRSESTLLGA